MNFASSHVYLYDHSDEEYVSDDEYESKTALSDSEDEEEEAADCADLIAPAAFGAPARASTGFSIGSSSATGFSFGSSSAIPAPPPEAPQQQQAQGGFTFGASSAPPPAPGSTHTGFFGGFGASTTAASGRGGRGGGLFGSAFGAARPAGEKEKERGGGLFGSLYNAAKSTFTGNTDESKSKKRKVKERRWKTEAKGLAAPAGCVPLPPPNAEETDKKWRRADTNVVSVQLEELVSPSNMHTGDFVRCHSCKGVISYVSQLKTSGEDTVWECDYCGSVNVVDVVEEEIPKLDDVTYMLSPAPTTTASGKSGKDESLVIFCMDTSGSMCVTTEVAGRIALRGDKTKKLQELNDTGENQWMPRQRRDVTYVSRLQSTQAAVDHQLETMSKEHPNRRVALVTFSSSVTYIGDGLQDEKILSGDKLKDQEQITALAKELTMPDSVKKCRETLGEKLFDLEEKGQTALGPALLLSVVMACRQGASKVIICTDGLANVGLGSLDTKSDEETEAATNFYTAVANMALEQGVSVSVITIEGTDCKLAELGRVADITGGQVNIVKPENLTKEFGTILANPIIATNVTAIFAVHNQLYIRDAEDDAAVGNWAERTVGNVTSETEITFEFGVRHDVKRQKSTKSKDSKGKGKADETKEKDEEDSKTPSTAEAASGDSKTEAKNNPKELPFQIQITYTDLEGARAMRVVTQKKPVTKQRQEAEKNVNYDVLGLNACQQSARLAQQGKFKEARLNVMMNQRLMYRQKVSADPTATNAYKGYMSNLAPLVAASGAEELGMRRGSSSSSMFGMRSAQIPQMNMRSVSDSSANIIYQAKKMPGKLFSSKPPKEDKDKAE